MGRYINKVDDQWLPAKGKAQFLVEHVGAKIVPAPFSASDWNPELVCVVDNGAFEAAGYCFDRREMAAFAYPDRRTKVWLTVPNAAKLAEP